MTENMIEKLAKIFLSCLNKTIPLLVIVASAFSPHLLICLSNDYEALIKYYKM
jgi:hypothetical protein